MGRRLMMLSLVAAIASAGGCGDDTPAPIGLEVFNPRFLEIPEGTPFLVQLRLSATPSVDDYVDIEYSRHKEFIKFATDTVKFTPYDDPPVRTVEVLALKVSSVEYMDVVFTVRSSTSSQTMKIRVTSP